MTAGQIRLAQIPWGGIGHGPSEISPDRLLGPFAKILTQLTLRAASLGVFAYRSVRREADRAGRAVALSRAGLRGSNLAAQRLRAKLTSQKKLQTAEILLTAANNEKNFCPYAHIAAYNEKHFCPYAQNLCASRVQIGKIVTGFLFGLVKRTAPSTRVTGLVHEKPRRGKEL